MKKVEEIYKAVGIVKKYKAAGKKIVLAGGCFDILHAGHIAFLEKSKKAGDVLVLLLEPDEAIRRLKGKNRPVNSQKNRAIIISSIEFVDLVIPLTKVFKTADYQKLVGQIRPDVIAVTEGDPNIIQKKLQAKESGGSLKIVLKKIPEHSTTKLLDYL